MADTHKHQVSEISLVVLNSNDQLV